MFFAALVVAQGGALHGLAQYLGREDPRADGVRLGNRHGQLQRVQRDAGVARRVGGDGAQHVVGRVDALLAESALGVFDGARQDDHEVLRRERFEREDARPRQQGGVDFKRRVLGGRADQDDRAALDERQEGVLLRLVEAVDFVYEDDGAAARLAAKLVGGLHHLADLADA